MKVFLALIALFSGYGCSTSQNRPRVSDEVESALMAKKTAFRACDTQDPTHASGRVLVEFLIGPKGLVTEAKVKDTSLSRPAVEECIVKTVRGIEFPTRTEQIRVSYPFKFSN